MEAVLSYIGKDAEMYLRIVVASICGGVIGFERSRRQKDAGLRTHIIVALGSALLMVVSKYGFTDVVSIPGMRTDASRIAANVVSGVSFLGTGVIFIRNDSVKGLTTAAGLWSVTGIGLAIGAGLYPVGIFSTILIVVIHVLTHGHLNKLEGMRRETISIICQDSPDGMERLKKKLQEKNIMVHHVQMEKNQDQTVTLVLDISRDRTASGTELADNLMADPQIKSFKL